MKLELQSASNFLTRLICMDHGRTISVAKMNKFRIALIEVLRRRYRDHWFPEKPFKDSGYRCIRINGRLDPILSQAGQDCNLSPILIHDVLPKDLALFIDPLKVSYRIGGNGLVRVLYEFKEGVNDPWRPSDYGAWNTSKLPKYMPQYKWWSKSLFY